jgi:predicted alpha/beta-fold hydrolase
VVHEFRPLPFLGNPHLQTLVGNLFRGFTPPLPVAEQRVLLPDGDGLVLHDSVPPTWRPGDRMVLIVHGLGGSHCSGYGLRMTARLWPRGVRVVRLDLRGAGRGAALARRTYNAGCSEDVRAAADELWRQSPTSPLALVGFSLGGNIVLKLAGEAAARPVNNLACVAAVAPPIDLEACAALLAQRRNRFYDRYFARGLVAQVRRQQRFFQDLPRVRFPAGLTLRLFDEMYTAPRGGFANALDYYRRSGALPLIARIKVPALVITARDDPFIAPEPFESLPRLSHLEVQVVPRGGHLGFLGRDGAGGIRWAERRVADWLMHSCQPAH